MADQSLTTAKAEELFDLLDHSDAAVRLAAHQTLKQRSNGRDFGYRFWADEAERDERMLEWRAWFVSQ